MRILPYPYPYASGGDASIAAKRESDDEVQILPYFPGDDISERDVPRPPRLLQYRPLPGSWGWRRDLPAEGEIESRSRPSSVFQKAAPRSSQVKRWTRSQLQMIPYVQYSGNGQAL